MIRSVPPQGRKQLYYRNSEANAINKEHKMSCPGPSILHTVCAMQGNPPASTEPVKKAKNKLAGPSAYPSLSFIVWPIAARVRKVCQDVPNGVETRVGMRVTLSANIDRDLVNGSEGTHHCVLSSPHHCVPSSPLRAFAQCCVLCSLLRALRIGVCSSHWCVLFSLLCALLIAACYRHHHWIPTS
jgi:hypothetical protein